MAFSCAQKRMKPIYILNETVYLLIKYRFMFVIVKNVQYISKNAKEKC